MGRLLDEDMVINIIKNGDYYMTWVDRAMLIEEIKDLPSAQKKGHWIDEGTNYFCSECHRGCWVDSDYCPWCGADMRKENK